MTKIGTLNENTITITIKFEISLSSQRPLKNQNEKVVLLRSAVCYC